MNVFAFHYPDADAFVSARVYVTRIFNRHLRIGGIKTARMFMIQTLSGPDKYFPERPVFSWWFGFHIKRDCLNNFFSLHVLLPLPGPRLLLRALFFWLPAARDCRGHFLSALRRIHPS